MTNQNARYRSVAHRFELIGMKVLSGDGSGYTTTVIDAIDVCDRQQRKTEDRGHQSVRLVIPFTNQRRDPIRSCRLSNVRSMWESSLFRRCPATKVMNRPDRRRRLSAASPPLVTRPPRLLSAAVDTQE
jgi:subtilisin family serine protease